MLNSTSDNASSHQPPPYKRNNTKYELKERKKHGNRFRIPEKLSIRAMRGHISAEELAPACKVSPATIYRIWKDPELDELSPDVVRETKKGLAGLFYKRALEATKSIDAEKLSQASALQLATVAGIMTEKGRLMEGLSTNNLAFGSVLQNIESDREKLARSIAEIEAVPDQPTGQ